MARRYFIKNSNQTKNGVIEIIDEEYNHIVNVLRAKVNDELIVCDNSGVDYICSIFDIQKKKVVLKIMSKEQNKAEPIKNITIFQALLKGEKMEFIVQKLTELGATGFVPFSSKFVTVKESTTRLERLNKISVEAAKQCGRAKSLNILPVQNFKQVLHLLSDFDYVVFAYENAKDNLNLNLTNLKNVAIIIGSEGGFSTEEFEQLKLLKNVDTVSLGNRILRAETASISLTALLSYYMGEWQLK